MERYLVLGSLGLGILGWICTLLLVPARGPKTSDALDALGAPAPAFMPSRGFIALAVLLPLVVWLLTLPTHPPFSSGQGWGRGVLLGGAGALAAFFALSRAFVPGAMGLLALRVAATAPLFAALAVTSVPLLWMRNSVIDALVGVGIGWVATTIVLVLGQNTDTAPNVASENGMRSVTRLGTGSMLLVNGAAWATALCSVAALGVYRDFRIAIVARGTFSALALALATVVALVLLLSALVGELRSRALALAVSLLGALALPLGLAFLLATKLLDNDMTLVTVVGAGLVLGFLLLWLVWDEVMRTSPAARVAGEAGANTSLSLAATEATMRIAYVPIWGVLVALAAFMFAYQSMQGFGVGLMLLAAWPTSLLALPSSSEAPASESARFDIAHALTLLLTILTVLLLSRLFATRFRVDLRGVLISDQFALFGFVAGAALPALLASLWFAVERPRNAPLALPHHASLPRLGTVALLALAPVLAMLAVWGAKVAPALFAGLALAVAGFIPVLASRRQPLTVALFSLAIGLTVAQWTHRLVPFATLPRGQRLHIVLWSLGTLVVLALVFDYGSRLFKRGRSTTPTIPAPPAGTA